MENWVLSLGISLVTFISTYSVMRYRIDRLQKDFTDFVDDAKKHHRDHDDDDERSRKDISIRIDAGFKKQDELIQKITVLERDTSSHIDMVKAEEKFVSKQELQLHLKNIETIMKHTDNNVGKMSKDLEKLTDILSTNVVRTLSLSKEHL